MTCPPSCTSARPSGHSQAQHRSAISDRSLEWPRLEGDHPSRTFEIGEPPAVVDVNRSLALIQLDAGEHAGEIQAVIAMEVRDADGRDGARRHAGVDKLPLRPFAWLE
jgi:hypothetical protein